MGFKFWKGISQERILRTNCQKIQISNFKLLYSSETIIKSHLLIHTHSTSSCTDIKITIINSESQRWPSQSWSDYFRGSHNRMPLWRIPLSPLFKNKLSLLTQDLCDHPFYQSITFWTRIQLFGLWNADPFIQSLSELPSLIFIGSRGLPSRSSKSSTGQVTRQDLFFL